MPLKLESPNTFKIVSIDIHTFNVYPVDQRKALCWAKSLELWREYDKAG